MYVYYSTSVTICRGGTITEQTYSLSHYKIMSHLEFDFATFEVGLDTEQQRLLKEIAGQNRWENGADRQTLDNLLPLLEQDGTPAMTEVVTTVHHALTEDAEQTLAKLTLGYRRQEQFEMATRLRFMENLSAAHHTQDFDVTDLQAEILSAELLPLEERFCWASAAAQLLPGRGINLDDPRAVTEALQFYATRQAEELDDEDEIDLLKSIGREIIATMYTDMDVHEHDDLDSQTTDLLLLVARVDRAPQMLLNFHTRELYKRAEAMGWPDPEGQVDRIITVLRRLRGVLDATR